ncbi:MAG: PA2779 family protein [Desulfobacterales bacterium]|jgi:predicted transcriptional regulator|nr:PA2779 family protein [Desulfobacterales bacterium]
MKRIYRIARPVSLILAVYVFLLSGPQQSAMAALVGTEAVMDSSRVMNAREAVRSLMAREDVQAALVRQGIDPSEAAARAEALSDAEAVRLADAVETLPAGGSTVGIIVGAILIVFIVLLITDILGYTNVFPFTKKHR